MEEEGYKIKRKPSEHFRTMCGKEALNSKGLLSKKDAVDLLNHYIRVHKLEEQDGFIFMNEWFQKLVQEFRPTIHKNDISRIVDKFFEE